MYNQEGKLEQWWTNATSEGFKVKQECIVNQYAGKFVTSVYSVELMRLSPGYYIVDDKGNKVHVNVCCLVPALV